MARLPRRRPPRGRAPRAAQSHDATPPPGRPRRPGASLWGLLLLVLVLCSAPAWAGPPPGADWSAITVTAAELRDPTGAVRATVPPWRALAGRGEAKGRLLVAPPAGEGEPLALAREAAVVVAGPPQRHQARLARLAEAGLPETLSRRLAAGVVEEGDTFWRVEMAWGIPQRSFMVNYFSDEQHYVYLRPGRDPVLVRFVGGRLTGPLPAGGRLGEPPSAIARGQVVRPGGAR